MTRTFIALRLSDALEEGILGLIDRLRREGIRASWARRSTLHLTLRFLGDVDEDRIESVVAAVRAAAARFGPLGLRTRSVGAFPSPRRPRVLWVGLEALPELFDLQAEVEEELRRAGFPPERRPFKAHVTFGRIRDPRAAGDLTGALASLEAPRECFEVRELLVMKSTLDPGGAIHEAIARVPLDGPRSE